MQGKRADSDLHEGISLRALGNRRKDLGADIDAVEAATRGVE